MSRKKVPVAAGVRIMGAKSRVSASRRPGMVELPQKRKPSTTPSTVSTPTAPSTKMKVLLSASQTEVLAKMSR